MSTIKTKIPLNNINMLSKEDFDNVNFEEHPNELFYTLDETDVIYSDVDAQLSDISENPVQNKVITKALNDKVSNEDISLDANTFAESERQKSKNLCGLKNTSQTLEAGLTCVFNEQTQTITLNGSPTSAVDCMREIKNLFSSIKNMENKQVTISLIYVSGKWTSGNARYYLGSLDNGSAYNDRVGNDLLNREADTIGLYTIPTNNTYDDLHFYMGAGCVFDNYVLKVQVEEGTVATDWQPYNGAIVHEGDIADVERIEVIYDRSSSNSNINWGYTSGIQSSTLISRSFPGRKTYRVYFCIGGDNYGCVLVRGFGTIENNFSGGCTIRSLTSGNSCEFVCAMGSGYFKPVFYLAGTERVNSDTYVFRIEEITLCL